jgi:hypothetical protein
MIKLKDLLTEANEEPQPGDRISLVVSSRYLQHFLAVKGPYVVVDNKYHKQAPGVILQKKGKELDHYKKSFKIKINNLKPGGKVQGKTVWHLKSTKKAIDGKDLEFDSYGRGMMFGYVEV